MTRSLLAALSVAVLFTAGCASSGDIQSMKDELSALRTEVEATRASADQASQEASEARRMAEAAQAQSMRTDEKIDRMFKKSMYK
jgi:murein lipoprotein